MFNFQVFVKFVLKWKSSNVKKCLSLWHNLQWIPVLVVKYGKLDTSPECKKWNVVMTTMEMKMWRSWRLIFCRVEEMKDSSWTSDEAFNIRDRYSHWDLGIVIIVTYCLKSQFHPKSWSTHMPHSWQWNNLSVVVPARVGAWVDEYSH